MLMIMMIRCRHIRYWSIQLWSTVMNVVVVAAAAENFHIDDDEYYRFSRSNAQWYVFFSFDH